MEETALLVIDVQVGIFEVKDMPLYNEKKVLANIKYLIKTAREKEIPVIYVQHNSPRGSLKYLSPAWKIHPELSPREDELVINKQFSDSFQETTLKAQLDKRGIKTLIIMGLQTDYCVDTTVRRAYSLEYETILASDAHSTIDGVISAKDIVAHHNEVLGNGFAMIRESKDII